MIDQKPTSLSPVLVPGVPPAPLQLREGEEEEEAAEALPLRGQRGRLEGWEEEEEEEKATLKEEEKKKKQDVVIYLTSIFDYQGCQDNNGWRS